MSLALGGEGARDAEYRTVLPGEDPLCPKFRGASQKHQLVPPQHLDPELAGWSS